MLISRTTTTTVIPAKAGIQLPTGTLVQSWFPACAGMTVEKMRTIQ
jgi:hypothetical protein